MTGRAAFVRTGAIGVFDLAIGVFARAADNALSRCRKPDSEVRKRTLKLRQNVTAQIGVARVLRREMDRDDERFTELSQCALIGRWKRVSPIFCEIDRCLHLRGQQPYDARRRYT